jgi:FkbM family methyltransferase
MEQLDIEKFDWSSLTPYDPAWYKNTMIKEIFENRIYERYFPVEEGDVVFDAGASFGPFTYSILHKNPKKVYCIEPMKNDALVNNTNHECVECHYFYIADQNNSPDQDYVSFIDKHGGAHTKDFMTFVKENGITKIDFLKTDCEGGEYCIFNEANFAWIVKNVRKISGEWHLQTPESKEKFRKFRDLYLRHLPHQVCSVDGTDIKWDLWNDHFIEYYQQVIIYIDNRS